jgi:hypothetical protein
MSASQEVGEIFGNGTGPATALLRSPTVIIASVGLWGMNVFLFRLFRIDYVKVLTLDLVKEKEAAMKDEMSNEGEESDSSTSRRTGKDVGGHGHDNGNDVTSSKLIVFSLSLLVLLHFSTKLWIDVVGGSTIGAIFAFYTAVVVGIVLPLPSTSWIRTACENVFHRAFELINPRCFCLSSGMPRAIPFIDVFFADAMCSVSGILCRGECCCNASRLQHLLVSLAEQSIFRLGNVVAFGVALSQSRPDRVAQHCYSKPCGELALFDSGKAMSGYVYNWLYEGEFEGMACHHYLFLMLFI